MSRVPEAIMVVLVAVLLVALAHLQRDEHIKETVAAIQQAGCPTVAPK